MGAVFIETRLPRIADGPVPRGLRLAVSDAVGAIDTLARLPIGTQESDTTPQEEPAPPDVFSDMVPYVFGISVGEADSPVVEVGHEAGLNVRGHDAIEGTSVL